MLKGRGKLRSFWLSFVFEAWRKRDCSFLWQKIKDDILAQLEDLPALPDLERVLRDTKAKKAPGQDGVPSARLHSGAHLLAPHLFDLLLKSMVHCVEAIFRKGGVLKMIPKLVISTQVHQFRGIMLLNLLPRRAHACFRPMLMEELEKER